MPTYDFLNTETNEIKTREIIKKHAKIQLDQKKK